MIYKTFQKVSNVCQLLDKSKYPATRTVNGVTFTNNGDGTITANGTASVAVVFTLVTPNIKKGHKYFFYGLTEDGSWPTFVLSINTIATATITTTSGEIFTASKDSNINQMHIYINSKNTVSNLVFKPQLFDLTEMYGAEHEPTTVEQFRQDFPEEMYDYSPHCFVKSYKTLLKVSNVCQLLDKSKYYPSVTKNGVTFTNNGDGTFTINGTTTAETQLNLFYGTNQFNLSVIEGHKYLFILSDIIPNFYFVIGGIKSGLGYYEVNNTTSKNYQFLTASTTMDGQCYAIIRIKAGKTCNNETAKFQLFDLTEMFGAGNEPSTVEQFKADFPNELYDYKPYSIAPSYKKSLICNTKNLFDIPLTRGYPSNTDFGNTNARTFTIGTYIIGLSANNYYIPRNVTNVNISKNSIYCSIKGSRYGVSIPYLLTVGNTYTLSCKIDNSYYPNIGITFYKEDGTLITYTSPELITNTFVKSFTVPENTYYTLILFSGMENNEYTFSNIQLELGSTATEYHPYGYL